MHILITGMTGFVGGYLAESLLSQGDGTVYGLSRSGKWPANLVHLKQRVQLHSCDLCDVATTERLLRELEPQLIFHLAGYAHAGRSLREPDAAWAGNLDATRSLYTAVERWGGRPRIVYAGSGLIYGEGQSAAERFAEDAPLRPANPYAASKAA